MSYLLVAALSFYSPPRILQCANIAVIRSTMQNTVRVAMFCLRTPAINGPRYEGPIAWRCYKIYQYVPKCRGTVFFRIWINAGSMQSYSSGILRLITRLFRMKSLNFFDSLFLCLLSITKTISAASYYYIRLHILLLDHKPSLNQSTLLLRLCNCLPYLNS